jgi:hypothetical protein
MDFFSGSHWVWGCGFVFIRSGSGFPVYCTLSMDPDLRLRITYFEETNLKSSLIFSFFVTILKD